MERCVFKLVNGSGDTRKKCDQSQIKKMEAVEKKMKQEEASKQPLIRTLQGHSDSVWSVSFSGDGRFVASGSDDQSVKIWEASTGACVRTLQGHSDWVRSVSFSADGRYVASGADDNSVKIWEVNTGSCVHTLKGHSNYVRSVSFSGDGRYVASGSFDQSVKIWDLSEIVPAIKLNSLVAACLSAAHPFFTHPLEDPRILGHVRWFTAEKYGEQQ